MNTEQFWTIYFPIILIISLFIIGWLIYSSNKTRSTSQFHKCWNGIPIVSIYSGFEYRNVIYQCKCGKRYLVKGIRADWIFKHTNLQTASMITGREIQSILNCEETEMNNFILTHYKRK